MYGNPLFTVALAGFYRGLCESEGSYERLLWTQRFTSLVKELRVTQQTGAAAHALATFVGELRRHWLDEVRARTLDGHRRCMVHDRVLDPACLSLLEAGDVFPAAEAVLDIPKDYRVQVVHQATHKK